jgi:hypothetical protein
MSLQNYKDLSTSGPTSTPGFQFEFSCCGLRAALAQPVQAPLLGQVTASSSRFAFLIPSLHRRPHQPNFAGLRPARREGSRRSPRR